MIRSAVILTFLLVAVYSSSLYNYILFHGIAEVFSVLIAGGIFFFAWNSRRYLKSGYFLFIGIAYLFVGLIDLAHMFAYKGMGVFNGITANTPTQLWIAARYLESFSLLIAFLFIKRKLNPHFTFLVFLLLTCFIFSSVFVWNLFPDCYTEAQGLTVFKKASETVISLMFLAVAILLFLFRSRFDEKTFRLLVAASIVTVFAELAFTSYIGVYDFPNMVGHLLKIISFYLIYKAVIETGLTEPYALLFKELKLSEDKLRNTNQRLEKEIIVRERSEKNLLNNQSRLETIIRTTADGIVMIDESGAIELFNPEAEQLFGYKSDEVMGQNIGMLMPEPYAKEHSSYIRHYLETGEKKVIDSRRELVAKRKGGNTFPMYLAVSESFLDGRRVFIGIVHDISTTRKMEEQFKKLFPDYAVKAESGDIRSLEQDLPDEYQSVKEQYSVLLEKQVEQSLYKVDHNVSEKLRSLGENLGHLKAGPKDIIDIHFDTLKAKTSAFTAGKSKAYIEETRLMTLELMGYLVSYYRARVTP